MRLRKLSIDGEKTLQGGRRTCVPAGLPGVEGGLFSAPIAPAMNSSSSCCSTSLCLGFCSQSTQNPAAALS